MKNTHKYDANPWFAIHLRSEYAFTSPRSLARELVLMEFQMAEPISSVEYVCRCGEGRLWYRATLGVHQCDSCRALARCNEHEATYLDKGRKKA